MIPVRSKSIANLFGTCEVCVFWCCLYIAACCLLCADGRSVVQHHVCLLTLLVSFLLAALASVLGRLATVFVGCLLTPQLGRTTRRLDNLGSGMHGAPESLCARNVDA